MDPPAPAVGTCGADHLERTLLFFTKNRRILNKVWSERSISNKAERLRGFTVAGSGSVQQFMTPVTSKCGITA